MQWGPRLRSSVPLFVTLSYGWGIYQSIDDRGRSLLEVTKSCPLHEAVKTDATCMTCYVHVFDIHSV